MASITYPTGAVETLRTRPTDMPGHVELRSHSFLTPLGPGDVLTVDEDGRVTGVVSLEPQWIYTVDLHLPADFLAGPMPDHHPAVVAAEQLAVDWARDTEVTQMTLFNLFVSSKSERWFADVVATSRYVEHAELIRTPDMKEIQTP